MDIKVVAGDIIKIEDSICGHAQGTWASYTVVEYRNCLGIFFTHEDKRAGELTPLSLLYTAGPESTEEYIPNYGPYTSNLVPSFILLAKATGE